MKSRTTYDSGIAYRPSDFQHSGPVSDDVRSYGPARLERERKKKKNPSSATGAWNKLFYCEKENLPFIINSFFDSHQLNGQSVTISHSAHTDSTSVTWEIKSASLKLWWRKTQLRPIMPPRLCHHITESSLVCMSSETDRSMACSPFWTAFHLKTLVIRRRTLGPMTSGRLSRFLTPVRVKSCRKKVQCHKPLSGSKC